MGRKKKEHSAQRQNFAESEEKKVKDAADEKKQNPSSKLTPEQIEREYADILNYQRKQRDNLLGNFSSGKYSIPDAIRAELLKIPKKFDEFDNNVARLSTILGRFVLNFKIVFTLDPDVCNAKLYIVEIEHDVEDDIKHETLLDEFEQAHNFEFRKIVFEKWHIFYDDAVLIKDDLLQNYLHMQQEENLFFGELDMILSQLFVVRMLALLDKMGELGNKVRAEFKLAMEKFLAKNPKYAQDFVFQKRLLDKFIAFYGALVVIAKTEEGAKILTGYSTPLKNVRDKAYPSTVVEPTKKKEEKKSEEKIQPTVKKKGGKPAKKADTKTFKFDSSKSGKLGINFSGGGRAQTPPIIQPRVQTPQTPQVQIPANPRPTSPTKEQTENSWSKHLGKETTKRNSLNERDWTKESLNPFETKSPDNDLEVKDEMEKAPEDLANTDEKNIDEEKPKESSLEFNL